MQYRQEDLIKLQKTEMDILSEVVRVCNENGITYFAVGGTALGAVRHSGFIPWDDDVDIGMLRDDYERFMKIAPEKLKEGYTLCSVESEPNMPSYFAKVRRDGTVFKEESSKNIKMHHGIFLDVMPYDKIPTDEAELKKYRRKSNFLMQLYVAKSVRIACITQSKKKQAAAKLVRGVLHFALKPVSKKWLFKKLDSQLRKYNSTDSHRVTTRALREVECDIADLIPPVKHKFEEIEINIPHNTDKILKGQYGDYMKLPPEEKRVNHAPAVLKF